MEPSRKQHKKTKLKFRKEVGNGLDTYAKFQSEIRILYAICALFTRRFLHSELPPPPLPYALNNYRVQELLDRLKFP